MSHSAPYDVFISYRRESGSPNARLLREALEKRGYRVFLDVEDLTQGHFDEALLREIERIPNFLVVLTPGCLDRCVHEGDWLRIEIAHALATGRRIVPVTFPGFVFPEVISLPKELRGLPRHQAVEHTHRYFDAELETLCRYFGAPSHRAVDPISVHDAQRHLGGARTGTRRKAESVGCLILLKRLLLVGWVLVVVGGLGYVVISRELRDRDLKRSVPYLREGWSVPYEYGAALNGDPEAQYRLAEEYREGSYALIQNEEEAAKWYEKAARAGYADAQRRLSVMYRDGLGVQADEAKATYWSKEAEKRGRK